MFFQFFSIETGNSNFKCTPVDEPFVLHTAQMNPDQMIAEVDRRFEELKEKRKITGQILVFTSTVGHDPGSIIAFEEMDPMSNKLVWGWHSAERKHAAFIQEMNKAVPSFGAVQRNP